MVCVAIVPCFVMLTAICSFYYLYRGTIFPTNVPVPLTMSVSGNKPDFAVVPIFTDADFITCLPFETHEKCLMRQAKDMVNLASCLVECAQKDVTMSCHKECFTPLSYRECPNVPIYFKSDDSNLNRKLSHQIRVLVSCIKNLIIIFLSYFDVRLIYYTIKHNIYYIVRYGFSFLHEVFLYLADLVA